MAAMELKLDRTMRFRLDEATQRKIDMCVQAERNRRPSDPPPDRSKVVRNAIDAYFEYLVCGYSLIADDDPRREGS